MSTVCEFCGKKTTFGIKYARRGAAKRHGGSGAKISGKNNRPFRPNLQKVRAVVDGEIRRVCACASCIQKGKVNKAPRGVRKAYLAQKAAE